jgi:hypothetical protein
VKSEAIANVKGDAGHPANKVVDKKRILGKGRAVEAQGVTDPPSPPKKLK